MNTTTVQPTGLDALFSSVGTAAGQLIDAYSAAEVARINAAAQPVATGGGSGNKGANIDPMMMGGIALGFVLVLVLVMRKKS